MGAVNEAAIRVTANTAPFQADMRRTTSDVKRQAGKMEASLGGALKRGFGEGKKNAAALLGSVRDITSQVLTLGGAVSGGMLVGNAVKAQQANIVLASKLSRVKEELVSVGAAQKIVEDATDRAGGSLEEMRTSALLLAGVADMLGKDGFADALARSTLQAKRFGAEGNKVAEIWARSLRQLGDDTSVDELESNLERLFMTVERMGQNISDVTNPEDIAEFLSKTQRTNLEFENSLVLMEMMVGKGREFGEALEFAEEIGLALGTAEGLQAITDAAKLSKNALSTNMSIAENFSVVIQKGPKAVSALMKQMGSDLAKTGLEAMLGKDFTSKGLRGKGRFTKAEKDIATAKIEEAFSRQAKATFDAAAIEEQNNAMRKTAGEQFDKAMRKLNSAFQSEKVTEAITKIAAELPGIVDPIADVVNTIVDNPWESLAAVVGGKLALAFAGPMITSAVSAGVTSMFAKGLAIKIGGAATTAALAASGVGVGGVGASTVLGGGTLAAGAGAGAAGMAAVASAATIAAGVVLAAGAGFAVGTGLAKLIGVEEMAGRGEFDALQQAQFATSTAGMVGPGASAEKIQAALEELKTSKKSLEESQGNLFQRALGGGAAMFEGEGAKSAEERRLEAAAKIEAESARLIEALSKIGGAAEGAARGLEHMKEKTTGSTRGTGHLPQVTGNAAVPG